MAIGSLTERLPILLKKLFLKKKNPENQFLLNKWQFSLHHNCLLSPHRVTVQTRKCYSSICCITMFISLYFHHQESVFVQALQWFCLLCFKVCVWEVLRHSKHLMWTLADLCVCILVPVIRYYSSRGDKSWRERWQSAGSKHGERNSAVRLCWINERDSALHLNTPTQSDRLTAVESLLQSCWGGNCVNISLQLQKTQNEKINITSTLRVWKRCRSYSGVSINTKCCFRGIHKAKNRPPSVASQGQDAALKVVFRWESK